MLIKIRALAHKYSRSGQGVPPSPSIALQVKRDHIAQSVAETANDLFYLLILIPLSLALALFHAPSVAVFISAAAAIVPLAEWIRRATEQVAGHAGSMIGGLLNVTFSNSAELILALLVLRSGNVA
jgi:Ca2+/H+ antiporter